MPSGSNEALELVHHLKIGGIDHHRPELNDLPVLTGNSSCVAARGFKIDDEIVVMLQELAPNLPVRAWRPQKSCRTSGFPSCPD